MAGGHIDWKETGMNGPDFTGARWRKSVVSGDSSCVEVARASGWVGVRDSKNQGVGPVLAFTEAEWLAFLAGAAAGEFSLDQLAH
jgi:hypothetical protein